ncbi:MAG: nickel-type superoxide dismutase maturation protease [Chloroflexota bacterium]|nr:nickel-type superoxide dismutase maturation protease [Chloroflexota bacterium]
MWRPLLDRLPVRGFVVRDTSMRPALSPGDRLLVGRWLRPRRRDLVVVRDPHQPSVYLVKRVASLEPNGDVVLLADNPNVSRDSRHFGAVPGRLIVGRVVFRYLPAERRGWLSARQ